MDKKRAIEVLTQHNLWRRDNHVPNSIEEVDATELGLAIDFAVKFLESHLNTVNNMKWIKENDPEKYREIRERDNERRRLKYRNDESYRNGCLVLSRKYYSENKAVEAKKKRDRYLNDDEYRKTKNEKDRERYRKRKEAESEQACSL